MSQTTTLILLPQTSYVNPGNSSPYTVTGNSQPAAAYYLGNQDLQTVNFKLTNCTANIVIEASLATNPTSNDWFKVYEYVSDTTGPDSGNASMYTNVTGNFVYMRAKLEDFAEGICQFIKLTY